MALIVSKEEDDPNISSSQKRNEIKAQENAPQRREGTIHMKGVSVVQKKEARAQSETLPGWTIMRPVKMGRFNGKSAALVKARNTSGSSDSGDLKATDSNDTGGTSTGTGHVEVLSDVRSLDGLLEDDSPADVLDTNYHRDSEADAETGFDGQEYRVYKRRWFGLVQLILLNIVVSWDVSTLSTKPPASLPLCNYTSKD